MIAHSDAAGRLSRQVRGLGSLLSWSRPAHVKADPHLMRGQLSTYYGQIKGSIAGNIIAAIILMVLYYDKVPVQALAGIGLLMAALTVVRLRSLSKYEREEIPARELPGQLAKINRYIAALGLIWGAALSWLICISDPNEAAFLTMVGAGMMAGGAISLLGVKNAVRNYILFIGVPTFVALLWVGTRLTLSAAALEVVFVVVLVRAAGVSFQQFVAANTRERELKDSAETVKMLLNDHQEQSADWLWEVDISGRLINPSLRFADAIERPIETLENAELLSLFDLCPEFNILKDQITDFRPFRNIAVPLTIDGEQRWWCLSGKQVQADDGTARLRGVASDISDLKNTEVKMSYMAHYDGLTGLPNRFLFNETLSKCLLHRMPDRGAAVLLVDLDNFAIVNDTLGHTAGDKLLRIVSDRIESCLGDTDIVARLGGDEFAILVSVASDRQTVESLAAHILQCISQPIAAGEHEAFVSASIGIVFAPDDGANAEILMKNADLALNSAKAGGRDRCVFFDPMMDQAAQARRSLELDLRRALGGGELALFYQPLVSAETGEPVAYEALVRWHHPTRGLVRPDEFIPMAEDTGLIVQLGEWVMRTAVAEAARWPAHLGVSVNLSPLQMKNGNVTSIVTNALANSGLAPHRLEIEITETTLMQDAEFNLNVIKSLKTIGARIVLDDFGVGYSSLNYLRCFPFDKIKIDRSFIEEIEDRRDCQAIVESIVILAKNLGMATTAEGVETQAQLQQLCRLGCEQLQGYLIGKPVPSDELAKQLRTQRKPDRNAPALQAAAA